MEQKSGLQSVMTKFTSKFRKQLKIALLIALFLFITGIIIEFTIQEHIILIIGAMLTAFLFFLHAFQALDIHREVEPESVIDSHGMIGFIMKLNYIALAINTMGVQYNVLQMPGNMEMLLIGGITISITFLYQLLIIQKPNGYLIKRDLLITNLLFIIISILLFL